MEVGVVLSDLLPGVETHLVEHDGKEGVYFKLVSLLLSKSFGLFLADFVDFGNRVDFYFDEVFVLHVLLAVNALNSFIEKLVEVDVPFIILDKIHPYDLFHDSLSLHVLHSKWFLHVEKEIYQVGIFHLPPMLVSGVLCPVRSEYLKILFKYLKDILLWKIVEIELLQDNEDEEIEHDNRTDHVERDKEDRGVPLSTVLARDATWFFSHVVKHEPVPVLAS